MTQEDRAHFREKAVGGGEGCVLWWRVCTCLCKVRMQGDCVSGASVSGGWMSLCVCVRSIRTQNQVWPDRDKTRMIPILGAQKIVRLCVVCGMGTVCMCST